MYRLLIIAVFTLTAIDAAEDIDINALASNITHKLNIPPEFLENSNITLPDEHTLEEVDKLFKEKCIKESGNVTAYDNAKNAQEVLKSCIGDLINLKEIELEMEKAKPSGDLDEVFKKYCNKKELLQQCVSDFTDTIDPCLDPEERENKKVVQNITESLATFVCFKDGDRIALFIAEGGFECLQSKQDQIQVCVNTTVAKHAPTEMISIDNLPQLLFKAEQCDDIAKLESCIVRELEGCSQPTPANIVESLFKFVRTMTPCAVRSSELRGSGNIFESAISTIILTMSAIFLLT